MNEIIYPEVETGVAVPKATRISAHVSLGLERLEVGQSILTAAGRKLGKAGIKKDERLKDRRFKFSTVEGGATRIHRTL